MPTSQQGETVDSRHSKHVDVVRNVSLPRTTRGTTWDVSISDGRVSAVQEHSSDSNSASTCLELHGGGALLAPSLCHPHIHLDKAFLLSHPKYGHLQIERGDFAEAMDLTGKAKSNFDAEDLSERGQRVIGESLEAGVTHMRAFVEVDAGVGTKCLEAGILLKRRAALQGGIDVQLCAFAQLPIFSSSPNDEKGETIRRLMQAAAAMPEVDVVGSTPYVESDGSRMKQNVDWMVELSSKHQKYLDFHLDYNVDITTEPLAWHVIRALKSYDWVQKTSRQKTVALGHCTRLSLFTDAEWSSISHEIGSLPISFVGLPSSDSFIHGAKSTLNIPKVIKNAGVNACIGINNIGNAFTPQGSCDPLLLASNGIGLYQAGTALDAELLYSCISTRARRCIGIDGGGNDSLEVRVGDPADFVLFNAETPSWHTRRSVSEVVYLYDRNGGRRVLKAGKLVQGGVS